MTDEVQYRPMTARNLFDHMSRFVDDNVRASDVDVRWLATQIEEYRRMVARVMNDRLEGGERAQVKAFRAAEIEKDIATKRDELAKLERDLKVTMGLTLTSAA